MAAERFHDGDHVHVKPKRLRDTVAMTETTGYEDLIGSKGQEVFTVRREPGSLPRIYRLFRAKSGVETEVGDGSLFFFPQDLHLITEDLQNAR